MKLAIILIAFILTGCSASAQFTIWRTNLNANTDSTQEALNAPGTPTSIIKIRGLAWTRFYGNVKFDSLAAGQLFNSPAYIVGIGDSGYIHRTPVSSLQLPVSSIPGLALVAATNSYNDLSNKPTIPAAQVNVNWNSSSGITQILNKPILATVAATGSYSDLLNKPTIPAGSVTSVGISSTDLSVSGSPVISSGNITLNLANSGVAAGVYGAVTVTAKGIVIGGKRTVAYTGTTDASGNFTITFSPAFAAAPNVQVSINPQTNTNQFVRVTALSASSCTINVFTRAIVSVLGVDLISGISTNVASATVDVLVTEK